MSNTNQQIKDLNEHYEKAVKKFGRAEIDPGSFGSWLKTHMQDLTASYTMDQFEGLHPVMKAGVAVAQACKCNEIDAGYEDMVIDAFDRFKSVIFEHTNNVDGKDYYLRLVGVIANLSLVKDRKFDSATPFKLFYHVRNPNTLSREDKVNMVTNLFTFISNRAKNEHPDFGATTLNSLTIEQMDAYLEHFKNWPEIKQELNKLNALGLDNIFNVKNVESITRSSFEYANHDVTPGY